MSFNYPLAKEIYGTAWSVDSISFVQLSSILKNLQNGVDLEVPEVKLNSLSLLEIKSETKILKNEYDLNTSESFEGIGVINLNGVITKNGGDSSFGTKQLASRMALMSKDSRVKGFIIVADSGGGATSAVKIMQDAINEVKKEKPVYTLIEKGGMAGSAAYGIVSASTKIYSEDVMNIVGSAGTMIQFSGKPNGSVDANGEKSITLYASKSTHKNKGFVEAIENDNYEIIINELLDPINEDFLESIVDNRPILKGTNFDNGHTVFSKDAIGTFIDGIASFDEVVSMVLSESQVSKSKNPNINSNSSKMTKQELKQTNPDLYSEILAEGAAQETERVAAWEAYREADSKAVTEGIKSGKEISVAQSHQFLAKLANKGKINEIISDSAVAIQTDETATVDKPESNEKELEEAFNFKL